MKSFKSMMLVGLLGFGLVSSQQTQCGSVKIFGRYFDEFTVANTILWTSVAAVVGALSYYGIGLEYTATQKMQQDAREINSKLAKIGQDEQTSVPTIDLSIEGFDKTYQGNFYQELSESDKQRKRNYEEFKTLWTTLKKAQHNLDNNQLIVQEARKKWNTCCNDCTQLYTQVTKRKNNRIVEAMVPALFLGGIGFYAFYCVDRIAGAFQIYR